MVEKTKVPNILVIKEIDYSSDDEDSKSKVDADSVSSIMNSIRDI
jgi:hypothetical protein